MTQYKFLVIDFEFTTYGDKSYGKPRAFFPEIIEVGAVLFDQQDHIETVYENFVRPRFFPRLTKECSTLTQIRQQDVDKGVDLSTVLENLSVFNNEHTFWVGYGEADHDVLVKNCEMYKIANPLPTEKYIDLATQFKLYYGKERRISLKHSLREVGFEPEGIEHTALADAQNAAQLLLRMIKAGWQPEYGDRMDQCL